MNIVVTGGYGFIGSALIRCLIGNTDHVVINIDKITYAANPESLANVQENKRHIFIKGDICDPTLIQEVLEKYKPSAIINLAAESHVDRSIDSSKEFIQTNILGTYNLLEQSKKVIKKNDNFIFHHVSTDEVYGDLRQNEPAFTEDNAYLPSSPYSSSKASSDLLVKAWGRTYGLPYVLSNCSNNYGPYQSLEKLIPMMIFCALKNKPLPVYGDGSQIRDWLYVEDHVDALMKIFQSGKIGETFNVGGNAEKTNLEVVKKICDILDAKLIPGNFSVDSFHQLIQFVEDRPGHDLRYAINSSKIKRDLNWSPQESFETGIEKTISWYLDNAKIFTSQLEDLTSRRGLKKEHY